jgi:ferric-dicitrate binding protein FerR (iron transport regulator)
LIRDNTLLVKQDSNLQVIVPSGEKTQLILPDGTQVWLNSESKLVYPASFSSRERKVNLEGEAYFNVTKVSKSKFTVYTQDVKVNVLGTKFNVKSYPNDPTIETTVVEGMVKVESEEPKSNFSPIILKPTERLVYKKDSRSASKKSTSDVDPDPGKLASHSASNMKIIISHVNTNNITSWKDHLLVFDNETFEEITLKLSRWYKVQIILLDEELKTQRYTGKFVHNESLTQVLEAIKLTTPIKYRSHQNQVEISLTKK